MRNIELGNLQDVKKIQTSKNSEILAENRAYPNEKSVVPSQFLPYNKGCNYISDLNWLIEFVLNGDNDAFNKIDAKIRPLLRNIAARKVIDRGYNTSLINDVVQSTILKVYEGIKLGKYISAEHLTNSAIRTLINNIEDIYRPKDKSSYAVNTRLFKVNSEGDFEVFSIAADGDVDNAIISQPISFDEVLESQDIEMDKIVFHLNDIADSHKEIISLRFFDGLSIDEIADYLDISETNANSRLFRATKSLRIKINKASYRTI